MQILEQAVLAETGVPVAMPLNGQQAGRQGFPENIAIECHENQVPPFVEAELDQLYGHINSSLSHFRFNRQAREASTYIARIDNRPIAILLFKRDKGTVSVINEMIRIEEEEILRFVNYIFTVYGSVSRVSFSLIHKDIFRLPFPSQQFDFSEDIVLTLPATPQAYSASLGKNMRRNIKRYSDMLARDYPSYRYQVYETEEISEQHVRDIIDLNKIRISGKNIAFGITDEETEWIVRLVKVCGLVGVATVDGRVCGGAIGFRIGANYFMHIIAHDPQYNDYSLGILCYYRTICEGIVRNGKRFHFAWGRYEYKYRLLGVQQDMAHLDIYRTRKDYLLNAGRIAKNAFRTRIRQIKMQLLDTERGTTPLSRMVARAIKILRKLKRFGLRLPDRA